MEMFSLKTAFGIKAEKFRQQLAPLVAFNILSRGGRNGRCKILNIFMTSGSSVLHSSA